MVEILDRHRVIALQCSGGRDSMASLYLMEQWWDRIIVVWCNTGAQYPEMIDFMARLRRMVPHFVEVTTDQPTSLAVFGHPSDVVPISNTRFGQTLSGETGIVIRDTWSCCAENIWFPMQQATMDLGATLVIRGQRADDRYQPPITSGSVIDGIEYLFPVEQWSRQDCDDYLFDRHVELPGAGLDHSSLDCWSCTGYADKSQDRARWMRERHPDLFGQYIKLVGAIADRVEAQYEPLRRLAAAVKE